MRHIFLPWLLLLLPAWAAAQNCGLPDTLLINPDSQLSFTIDVDGYFNDDLADPDQGLCGVEIEFVHAFSENLELWLTSPNGDSVQLIGPNTNDNSAFTFAALWDITFVPCAAVAMPDSGYVAQWDNNQPNNFVAGGQYRGSYYPFDGCLEDFATGPVNGPWTIHVLNDPSFYPGALIDFRLVFCDTRGVECCFSDSGFLPDTLDMLACEGDPALLLESLGPLYPFFLSVPDSTEYGYTYALGESGVLIDYDSVPDLRAFPPGDYQVCGLSYKRNEIDSFPPPDGLLTLDSLRNNLNSPLPMFCGELTDSCISVTIIPVPDTTFLTPSICVGDSLAVADTVLYEAGQYFRTLESIGGCDSIVAVDLTVLPVFATSLEETICEGDSLQVGPSVYFSSGLYVDTLTAANGCDSTVTLDLQVVPPDTTNLTNTICAGDTVFIGSVPFTTTGTHQVTLTSSLGCDSTVNLELAVLDPQAVITPPDTLTCVQTEIILDGNASTPAGELAYQWIDGGGGALGTAATQAVATPGDYQLVVVRSTPLLTCADTTSILVLENTTPPVADAGPPDTLTCAVTELTLQSMNTSQGPNFTYQWSTSDGQITGPADSLYTRADAAGNYTLIVTDTENGCSDTSQILIAIDTLAPTVDPGPDRQLDCNNPTVTLDGVGSSAGPAFVYDWQSTTGITPDGADTPVATADQPGDYRLLVRNIQNGCADSAFATVTIDTLSPTAVVAIPGVLNCTIASLTLDGSASDSGPGFDLLWRTGSGADIVSGGDSLTPEVDQPGDYELVILNLDNGCRDSVTVSVTDTLTIIVAEAGPDTALTCAVTSLQLDGSASTISPDAVFNWSALPGNIVGNNDTAVVTIDAPGTYQLIVTDTVTLCADTSEVLVEIDTNPPLAEAGPARLLTCTNTVDTLDGRASTAGAGIMYEWSGPCLLSDPAAPWVLADCPGTYFLSVTDEANGCTALDSVLVTQDMAFPNAQIEAPDTLTCTLTELILDGSTSTEGPMITYDWQGPGILSGNVTSTSLVNEPGEYTLIVSDTVNACADTALVMVIQDTLAPVVTIAVPDTLTCAQPEVTLDGAGSSTETGLVYLWTTNGGNLTGPTDSLLTWADTTGNYTLTITDQQNGCVSEETVSVTADQQEPLAEAGPDQLINCADPVVTLDGGASSAGPDIEYEWSGSCLTGSTDEPTAQADCPGVYDLLVTDTGNGCTALDSMTVDQNETPPVAEAGLTDTLNCLASELTLDGTGSSQGAAFVYNWIGPGLISGGSSLSPQVNEPGAYFLSVTDTTNNCTTLDSVAISIDTLAPVADAGPTMAITCSVDTITLGGPGTSTGPDIAYEWFSVEGNPLPPADQATVQTATPGVYLLFVTNTRNGCADTAFVNVGLDLETPDADAGSPAIISCADPTATLDGSDSDAGDDLVYQWTGLCLLNGADSTVAEVDCPGDYVLTVTNQANGCSSAATVTVSLAPETPSAVLSADTVFLSCVTGTVMLNGSASTPGPVEWLYNGQPSPLTGDSPTVDAPGLYTLIVSNLAQDCADTADAVVLLDCDPLIGLPGVGTITCYEPSMELRVTVEPSGVDYTFQWTTVDSTCILGPLDTDSLTVTCAGTYTVIATNPVLGLSDTASVTVAENRVFPLADAGVGDTLICTDPNLTVGGTGTSTGPEIAYVWTNFNGDTLGFEPLLPVDQPDTYFLEVVDMTNGCADDDFVIVTEILGVPDILFGNTLFPCNRDTFDLQAFLDPPDSLYQLTWTGPGIAGPNDSLTVPIDTGGVYALTVVNPVNNCVVSDTVFVAEQECGPCIEIAAPDTLTCAVNMVTLQANYCEPCPGCTFEWETDGGTIEFGEDTFNPVVSAPGEYILTATDTLGVATVRSVTVMENTAPPAVSAGLDRELTCGQTSVVLGDPGSPIGSAFTYEWTSLGGVAADPPDQPLATITAADTFVLRMENLLTGCFARDTVVVTTDTIPPLAEAGPDLAITCESSLVSPDGAGSSLGGNFNYQWTTDSGGNISGATTLNPVVGTPGVYYLRVIDGQNQCTAVDSMRVNLEDDLPILPVIADTSLTCIDTLVVLPGTLPAPSGYTFEWCRLDSIGMPGTCRSDTLALPVTEPGEYQFNVVDDSTGCTSQLIVEVTLEADPPTAEAGATDTLLCNMTELMLEGTAGPAGLNLQVQWTATGDSPISQPTSLTPTVFEPDTYYLLVVNAVNQCAAIDSVVVVRDENAPVALAGPDTLLTCNVAELRLRGESVTASGAANYLWETTDGRILADSTTAEPLVDQPGTYVLTVTDPQNGCSARDSLQVGTNRAAPVALLTDTMSLTLNCQVDTVTLDGGASFSASGAGLSYNWTAGPSGQIGGGDPATALIRAVTPAGYRLVVTDAENGCRDTLDVTVAGDFSEPTVMITSPASLTCTAETISLNAAASSAGSSFTNRWTGPAGEVLPDTSLTPIVNLGGDYTLLIRNTDNGCLDSATVTVGVDTLAPLAAVIPPAELDCAVPEVRLDGQPSSQGPGLRYEWLTGDGLLLAGQDSIVATAGAAGLYILTVTDEHNGCVDSVSVTVAATSAAVTGVQFTLQSPPCDGAFDGSIQIDSVSGGTPPFVYAVDEGNFLSFGEFNNLPPGSYLLRVQDANGCEYDTAFIIMAPQEITVNLGQDTTIRQGDSLLIVGQTTAGEIAQRRWTAGGAALALDTLSWVASPVQTTTYGLTVVDVAGCTATDFLTVRVEQTDAVFIPSAFSPNGDGHNDRLLIFAGKQVTQVRSFYIFDRWGNQVFREEQFQPNDATFGWDGTFLGRAMNPAVFVYRAEVELADGRVEVWQGDVVLVR